MKALGVATVVCLFLSLAFAGLAYSSPVRSQPPSPSSSVTLSCSQLQNETQRQVDACWNKVQAELYEAELAYVPKEITFTSYQMNAGVTEGFAVLTLLFALLLVFGVPKLLRRRLLLPRPARLVLLSAMGVGLGVFVLVEFINVFNAGTQFAYAYLFRVRMVPGQSETAALGLLTACVCLGALRAKDGMHAGIKSGVMLGAAIAFVAQMSLWAFDYKEMYNHVTAWMTWSWGGVYLVSNWFVLVVASGLVLLYCIPPAVTFLIRKEMQREDRLLSRMGFGP